MDSRKIIQIGSQKLFEKLCSTITEYRLPFKEKAVVQKREAGCYELTLILKEVLESEKSILRNLYSLYLHELSNFTTNLDIGEDGVFHYEELDRFWEVDGLSPYFIMLDEKIIGFILLIERPFLTKENDYGINDFFILNRYKGKGYAMRATRKIFEEKPGQYFVIQVVENKRAVSFWKKVYTGLNIQTNERQDLIDEELCLIQTFKV